MAKRYSSPNPAAKAFQAMRDEYGAAKPHRSDNESVGREQERFDRAQVLIKMGKLEEARKICWWPKNEEPPTKHWSRVGIHVCYCGKHSPDGVYGLCGYCGGTTAATPSLVTRRASAS